MGNAARSENHRGRSRKRVCRQKQRVVDAEIAFETDAVIRSKNRHDAGYEANTVTLAGDATLSAATIRRRRRTPPTALTGRHCAGARRSERAPRELRKIVGMLRSWPSFGASMQRLQSARGQCRFPPLPQDGWRRALPLGRSSTTISLLLRRPRSEHCSRRRPSHARPCSSCAGIAS
jgi:hypothetical protein